MSELLKGLKNATATKTAVAFREQSLTFQSLFERVTELEQLTGRLTGRRVVILLPEGFDSVVAHISCFTNGACLIPISPLIEKHRLKAIVELVRPHLVISNSQLFKKHFSTLATMRTLMLDLKLTDSNELLA